MGNDYCPIISTAVQREWTLINGVVSTDTQFHGSVPPWQKDIKGPGLRAGLRLPERGVLMLAMKPHIKLAETRTPDGKSLTLHVHDGDYSLRVNGRDLMHSSVSASELHLGELAAEHVGGPAKAKVLIGGLGMGYTLKSVLAAAGPNVTVVVAELIPEVVDWNRTFLGELNGKLLDDPRVKVLIENVNSVLGRAQPGEYDAVLLDIDNGPTAMVQAGNAQLYDKRGIVRILRAVKPGGRAAIWSASVDREFAMRLKKSAGKMTAVPARLHPNAKRSTYTIYVADKTLAVVESNAPIAPGNGAMNVDPRQMSLP